MTVDVEFLLAEPRMKFETSIDVGTVTSREELHALLAESFGFPDYYGMNWDAFDECIRDFAPSCVIRVTGIEKLRSLLQREAWFLEQSLREYQVECRNECKIIYS